MRPIHEQDRFPLGGTPADVAAWRASRLETERLKRAAQRRLARWMLDQDATSRGGANDSHESDA